MIGWWARLDFESEGGGGLLLSMLSFRESADWVALVRDLMSSFPKGGNFSRVPDQLVCPWV